MGIYKSDSERRSDNSIGELKRGLARIARTARTWTRLGSDSDSAELQVVTTKNKVNIDTQNFDLGCMPT